MCAINSYLDDLEASGGKCVACPADTYSHAGSYGKESCKARRPCTEEDFVPSHTACSGGKRVKRYDWKLPKICSDSHYDSVKLPPDEKVDCRGCGRG